MLKSLTRQLCERDVLCVVADGPNFHQSTRKQLENFKYHPDRPLVVVNSVEKLNQYNVTCMDEEQSKKDEEKTKLTVVSTDAANCSTTHNIDDIDNTRSADHQSKFWLDTSLASPGVFEDLRISDLGNKSVHEMSSSNQDFTHILINPSSIDAVSQIFDWRCTVVLILHKKNEGFYGHGIRNVYQRSLRGDYIMHADDDVYTKRAFDIFRYKIGHVRDNLYFFSFHISYLLLVVLYQELVLVPFVLVT